MKIKLLIIGAALSVFLLNAQATDLFECIKEAEIWLKSSYSENPVTLKVGLERLEKIGASSLSDEEKVQEIKNKFPKAFEKISAEDAFEKGIEFSNQENYAEEVKWYRKAAEQGDAVAQFNLGLKYDNGQGVAQDYTKAVYWYTKSAEQGIAQAQFNLGLMYYNGQGVSQDYAKAVELFTKSAEQGDATAQCNLGNIYENGTPIYSKTVVLNADGSMTKNVIGIAKDHKKAIYWYTKAAEQGNADAQKALDSLKSN